MSSGTVYWFTGLAGAGKTTLGHLFFLHLKSKNPATVFLDGDQLREVFGNNLGYSKPERLIGAQRNSRLCRMLTEQGIDVVCTTISLFYEISDWNKKNFNCYKEIFIKVPMKVLQKRDQKQLYSQALKGEIKNVMGVDIQADEPENPTMTIINDGTHSPQEIVNLLIKELLH